MKIILAGVVFAALTASPLSAQSQSNEGSSRSGVYPEQKKQLRVDYRVLDGAVRKSHQPTSNMDPMKQGLCGAAPGFCLDYHGSNGG